VIDRTDTHLFRRKVRDRSIALVLTGMVLLLPPIAGISSIDLKLGGVPTPLVFVFVVWALLIAGAAALARPLRESETVTPSNATATTDKIDAAR
jgi:hypothetical protein